MKNFLKKYFVEIVFGIAFALAFIALGVAAFKTQYQGVQKGWEFYLFSFSVLVAAPAGLITLFKVIKKGRA